MRPMYQKANIVRDREARLNWLAEQGGSCMVCLASCRGQVQLHHIIRGSGRSDEECNFLLVCHQCHERCPGHDGGEYPKLTLGQILTCKVLADPTCYDRPRLEELYGSPLELEPMPDWLLLKRMRRGK